MDPYPSGSLSTGAKAGIGVGVAAAAIVAIGLVVLVCARRKKEKARTDEKALAELPSDLSNRQEMDDTTCPSESVLGQGVYRVYELGS
jgi:NADP-dependent 3-hydroxy acid dehydrogenase YdfG